MPNSKHILLLIIEIITKCYYKSIETSWWIIFIKLIKIDYYNQDFMKYDVAPPVLNDGLSLRFANFNSLMKRIRAIRAIKII